MGKSAKPKSPIEGVVCYWTWVGPKKPEAHARCWSMVEAYGITEDGGYTTTPSTGGNDRHDWENWLNQKKYLDKDKEDWDWEPLMGRCVTMWTWNSGVSLVGLHPIDWEPHLSISFVSELKKVPNWPAFLEHGHALYLDTARVAQMIVTGEKVKFPFRS